MYFVAVIQSYPSISMIFLIVVDFDFVKSVKIYKFVCINHD